jgi:hypothetical protein
MDLCTGLRPGSLQEQKALLRPGPRWPGGRAVNERAVNVKFNLGLTGKGAVLGFNVTRLPIVAQAI